MICTEPHFIADVGGHMLQVLECAVAQHVVALEDLLRRYQIVQRGADVLDCIDSVAEFGRVIHGLLRLLVSIIYNSICYSAVNPLGAPPPGHFVHSKQVGFRDHGFVHGASDLLGHMSADHHAAICELDAIVIHGRLRCVLFMLL
jgi:hypothetical protein